MSNNLDEFSSPEELEVSNDVIEAIETVQQQQYASVNNTESWDESYGLGDVSSGNANQQPAATASFDPRFRRFTSLEDLYESFPAIGSGTHYLRIIRKKPVVWSGVHVAGFLKDIHKQITLEEFAREFGGFEYEVSVRGSGRATVLDGSGKIQDKTLATLIIQIPGNPRLENSGEPMAINMMNTNSPQVEVERLKIEAAREQRRDEREELLRRAALNRPQHVDTGILNAVSEISDKQVRGLKEVQSEVIDTLRMQIGELRQEAKERDILVQQLRERLMNERTQIRDQMREEETKQVRELKERHEQELRRIEADHNSILQRLNAEYQRQINDMTDRNQRERENIQKSELMERERLRTDAERRENQLQEEARRREQAIRESYEGRLNEQHRTNEARMNDLERATNREVESVKDLARREVESVRTQESSKSLYIEKTAEQRVQMLQMQIAQLTASLEESKRENTDLRLRVTKDPLTAIKEAHELVEQVGGGNNQQPAAEEFDWKKDILNVVKAAAPEALKILGSTREQNQMAAMRQQHQQQPPQQYIPENRIPQMTAAPRQQPQVQQQPQPSRAYPTAPQRKPRMTSGPPQWSSPVPLGVNGPMVSAPPPISGGPAAELEDGTVPIMSEMSNQGVGSEFITPPTVQHAPPPQQAAEPAEPQPGQSSSPVQQPVDDARIQQILQKMGPKQIDEFTSGVKTAIEMKIPVEQFVNKIFEREEGPEMAIAITRVISVDQLLAMMDEFRQKGGQGADVFFTRDGRKFIVDVWQEISSRKLN